MNRVHHVQPNEDQLWVVGLVARSGFEGQESIDSSATVAPEITRLALMVGWQTGFAASAQDWRRESYSAAVLPGHPVDEARSLSARVACLQCISCKS